MQGQRKRQKRKRSISWSRLGREPKVAASQDGAEKSKISVFCRVQSIMCCAVVLVIIFIVLFWMKAFTEEDESRIGDAPTIHEDLSTEDGLLERPFVRERQFPHPLTTARLTTGDGSRFLREYVNESSSAADSLS
ncbi:hypothetical protein V5799_006415 [Amblyomma americanum]|uniref:Uncharacterized protein n=1 Tax=Amblyomma americanum TaxID=6943 RepID=A0AAQ4DWG4_AMBAM